MSTQIMPLEVNLAQTESGIKVQRSNKRGNKESFSSVLNNTQAKKESTGAYNAKDKKPVQPINKKIEDSAKTSTEAVTINDLLNQVEGGLIDEEAVIEVIADMFQKSTDEIEQILAALQLGVMDLLQIDNLRQLVMQVYNVDEPMDLLLIPEVSENMKAITQVIEEYLAQTPLVQEEKTEQIEQMKMPIIEDLMDNKNLKDLKNLEENNKLVDTKPVEVDKSVEAIKPKEELSSSGQDQESAQQGSSAERFIHNLSQAMNEVFQWQQDQTGEIKESTDSKNMLLESRMVLDQIVERIKSSITDEKAQISIQLKPEHLGKLTMKIVSEQGIMTAQFTVESEKTKAMIEQNIQDLREVLENKGLTIHKLEVAVGENQQDDNQFNQQSKPAKNISRIIERLMDDSSDAQDLGEIETDKYETSEVNYIA